MRVLKNHVLELWRRLRHLADSRRMERDTQDEIRFHLESRIEELRAEGSSFEEARRRAQREFGGTSRIREDARAAWQFTWLEDLWSDLHLASRGFAKSPGFTLVAVLSLALGTGANTAIFSLASSFLLNKPSCRDSGTLARLRVGGNSHIPAKHFEFLRGMQLYEGVAGVREESPRNWNTGRETRRIDTFSVSDNYFDLVGVPVAQGRGIRTGETDTVVVSHQFWQSQMGAIDGVVGRTLVLDAKLYTIVGVLQDQHRTISGFGLSPALYVPAEKNSGMLAIIARLAPGTTAPQALEELAIAARELDRVYPEEHSRWSENLRYFPVEGIEAFGAVGPIYALLMFFGLLGVVVGLVLLIACANVSGLLMARTAARRQEISVRLSLGAPRNRILRQWLAESMLLAAIGTVGGLGINRLLISLAGRIEVPLPLSIRIVADADERLTLYACAIAILCALLVGIAPAIYAMREGVITGLKRSERNVGSRQRFRRVIVVGQMAACSLLLATGFLFLRNLQEASAMQVGFDTENTTWASVRLLEARYTSPEARASFVREMISGLEGIAGVERATIADMVPLTDGRFRRSPIRSSASKEATEYRYNWMHVGPSYFETMGIPLMTGREFSPFDRENSGKVVIINQTMARQVFAEVNPVGQVIYFRDSTPVTVVGVVADSKYTTLGENGALALYEPWFQSPGKETEFLVRSSESPAVVVGAIRKLFSNQDSSAAVDVKPVSQAMGLALLPSRGGAIFLGGLGALGLLLAAVGLAGMIAYSVQGRTKEIGLRVAMGATPRRVYGLIASEATWITGLGLALGLGSAVFAAQPLAMFLVPDVHTTDPIAFGAVVLVLLLVAFGATLAPARRALGIAPVQALRDE